MPSIQLQRTRAVLDTMTLFLVKRANLPQIIRKGAIIPVIYPILLGALEQVLAHLYQNQEQRKAKHQQ